MNTHHSFALWYANFDGPRQELPVEGHGHEGDRDIWFGMSGPDAAGAEAETDEEGGDVADLKG